MVGHLLIRSWWGVTENVVSPVFADCFCQLILKLFIAIIYLNPFTKILKISFIWNRSAFTQRNQSTIPSPLNSFLDFQGNLLIYIPKKPNLWPLSLPETFLVLLYYFSNKTRTSWSMPIYVSSVPYTQHYIIFF